VRQRSRRAAGSKRQELALNSSVRICCIFHVTKCSGEYNLGLCTTSGLVKRMQFDLSKGCSCVVATSDWTKRLAAKIVRSRRRAAALFWQVPKLCTDLDRTLLYTSILGTYSKVVWKIFAGVRRFECTIVAFFLAITSPGPSPKVYFKHSKQ